MNSLFEQLEKLASRSPGRAVLETADRSINISDLMALIQEVAFKLRAGGFKTVALCADNSPEWVVVDLACQRAGICLVPLPTFFSSRQCSHVFSSAGIDLFVYQQGLECCLPDDALCLEAGFSLLPSLNALPVAATTSARVPLGTSKITFTSGSTGEPKGVCLSSDNCLNVASSLVQATGLEAPRHLCVLPLPVLLENVAGLYAPLLAGGCVITVPLHDLGFTDSSSVDPATFLSSLSHYQPNTLILVPQLLTILDRAMAMGWTPPTSLRFIAVGGARVAAPLVERVRERGLPVYEGYGLSECASVVSVNCPGRDRPGTSGQVLSHLGVAEQDGQLRVTGNAFLGYLNQPETWYQDYVDTGDIGTVDTQDFVTIKGRVKTLLINSYGRNISPEWVESELAAAGVFRQVIVFGDARPYCTALLLPIDEACPDEKIQIAVDDANKRLPDYARIGAWARLPEPLTAADGLLTDNGRPRRDLIESTYNYLFETLYSTARESNAQ